MTRRDHLRDVLSAVRFARLFPGAWREALERISRHLVGVLSPALYLWMEDRRRLIARSPTSRESVSLSRMA